MLHIITSPEPGVWLHIINFIGLRHSFQRVCIVQCLKCVMETFFTYMHCKSFVKGERISICNAKKVICHIDLLLLFPPFKDLLNNKSAICWSVQ